jgi:DtxR family Mn-dependent transcriptional regulator
MSTEHSATVDKYLETIFYIAFEGESVRPGRLASWLDISPPTVTEALRRLERDGWVEINDDRSITLTAQGELTASSLVRRHRILERWLCDVLGIDWATADEEADRLSSSISDLVIDRIDAAMNEPLTCPHGNSIPGRRVPYGTLTALADTPVGSVARLRRISEVSEHEARYVLGMLADSQIHEGSVIEVVDVDPATHAVTVIHEGAQLTFERTIAELLWIELVENLTSV